MVCQLCIKRIGTLLRITFQLVNLILLISRIYIVHRILNSPWKYHAEIYSLVFALARDNNFHIPRL